MDEITLTPSSEDQRIIEAWPVRLDEVRRCSDHALIRIQVSYPFEHQLPPGIGRKIAAVISENWLPVPGTSAEGEGGT